MISLLRPSAWSLRSARRTAYEKLFGLIKQQTMSTKAAYSAWLFLGQLEKQYQEESSAMAEAYRYFAARLSKGKVSEWESVVAGPLQMSSEDFSYIYHRIQRGDLDYDAGLSAYQGGRTQEPPYSTIHGWAPDSRYVGKFLEQLALLLECGVPLTDSLETLRNSSVQPYLDKVTEQMLDEVTRKGTSLSKAMSRHPLCFPSPVIALVRSGESGGFFTHALRRAADLMEKQNVLKARIKRAVASPAVILGVGGLIVFGIVKFIIPKFLEVYDQMNLEMPALSQAVIRAVTVVNNPWFLLLLALSSGAVYYRRDSVRQLLFDLGLRTPMVGRWIRVGLAKEMCDILSDLHTSGVPLQRSFRILAECTNYDTHRVQMLKAADLIQTEGTLAETLSEVSTLPRIVVTMAHVGEEAGALDSLLKSLAKVLDEELDSSLDQFVTTIEPIALALLGIGIAVLFVGLFLPIYGVIGSLG